MKWMLPLGSVFVVLLATWMIGRAGAASRCVPKKRFVVLSGELVRDTLTNLVWQQTASTTGMTWTVAQTYCPTGFRLPTVKELASLVDLTVTSGPSIDQTAFPSSPADDFWTSSPYADRWTPAPNLVWFVRFSSGTLFYEDMGYSNRVRCVR
jgi:hypothetical protein